MSDLDKLHAICRKNYKGQAIWFLNCFWEEFASQEAELLWQMVVANNELDLEYGENGTGLDETKAKAFLEKFGENMTIEAIIYKLRSAGVLGISEIPNTLPLVHFLICKYNVSWHTLVDEARQGESNDEEIEKADMLITEAETSFQESQENIQEARIAQLTAHNSINEISPQVEDGFGQQTLASWFPSENNQRTDGTLDYFTFTSQLEIQSKLKKGEDKSHKRNSLETIEKQIGDLVQCLVNEGEKSKYGVLVPLMQLGLDSLATTQLVKEINSAFGIHLPPTILFDFPTVEKLSNQVNILVSGVSTHLAS